jgi:hypothetical protein
MFNVDREQTIREIENELQSPDPGQSIQNWCWLTKSVVTSKSKWAFCWLK